MPLAYSLLAAALVSLISLVGILTLGFQDKLLKKVLLLLVGFASGGLLGGALLHLLPEAVETKEGLAPFLWLIIGFALFFFLERIIHWHHCHEHEGECPVHVFAYTNLMGDAIHNFVDGVIIISSFMVSIPLGIAVTISIIFHEIPQEISDFGVLVYAGVKKSRALFYNFLTALTALLGVGLGYLAGSAIEKILPVVLSLAAGGFVYISASDLIPELHKESQLKKSLLSFGMFVLGVAFMWWLKMREGV